MNSAIFFAKNRKKVKIVFDKWNNNLYNIKARLLGGGNYATGIDVNY